jgi:hypothetical protein
MLFQVYINILLINTSKHIVKWVKSYFVKWKNMMFSTAGMQWLLGT